MIGGSLLHRRDLIVVTAIDLIDEVGLTKFSTRELAKRMGISEATIFKHYHSKNELLLAMIQKYASFDNELARSVAHKVLHPLEAIRYFIYAFAEYYENYPAITSVLHLYDVLSKDPTLNVAILDIYRFHTTVLTDLVNKAKKSRSIREEVPTEELVDVFLGIIRSVTLRWRLSGYTFSLKDKVVSTMETTLRAFSYSHY